MIVLSRSSNIVNHCRKKYKTQPESRFTTNSILLSHFTEKYFRKSRFTASNEITIDENKTKPCRISRGTKLGHSPRIRKYHDLTPSLHCNAIQQLNVIFTMITTSEGCTGFLDWFSCPSSIPGIRNSCAGDVSLLRVGEASSEWYPELLPCGRGSIS